MVMKPWTYKQQIDNHEATVGKPVELGGRGNTVYPIKDLGDNLYEVCLEANRINCGTYLQCKDCPVLLSKES